MRDDIFSSKLLLQMRKSSFDHGSRRLTQTQLVKIIDFEKSTWIFIFCSLFFFFQSACNLNLLREQMNLMHLVEYQITSSETIIQRWIASIYIFNNPLIIFDILFHHLLVHDFKKCCQKEKYVYHKIKLLLSI